MNSVYSLLFPKRPAKAGFEVGRFFPLVVRKRSASNESFFLLWKMSCPVLVVPAEVEQPPRRVLASRRLLFAAVGVPRFDPRPEGKGAGVQNAGMRAPVGRCLRGGGVGFRVVSAFPLSVPPQRPEVERA